MKLFWKYRLRNGVHFVQGVLVKEFSIDIFVTKDEILIEATTYEKAVMI